jgi:hypothetical protein
MMRTTVGLVAVWAIFRMTPWSLDAEAHGRRITAWLMPPMLIGFFFVADARDTAAWLEPLCLALATGLVLSELIPFALWLRARRRTRDSIHRGGNAS